MSYEFVEHTADVRVHVQSHTLEDVFKTSVQAMMQYLFDEDAFPPLKPDTSKEIKVESVDRESLLVDFLSAVLFSAATEHSACIGVEVEQLQSEVIAARISLVKMEAIREIKAVTYNDLKLELENGTWSAFITFDI